MLKKSWTGAIAAVVAFGALAAAAPPASAMTVASPEAVTISDAGTMKATPVYWRRVWHPYWGWRRVWHPYWRPVWHPYWHRPWHPYWGWRHRWGWHRW